VIQAKRIYHDGDTRVREHYCLFPFHWYDHDTKIHWMFWLEKILITEESLGYNWWTINSVEVV